MKTLSVATLSAYIQDYLSDNAILQNLWVTGEVSSLYKHSKAVFFSLSDPQDQSLINCVIWANHLPKIQYLPQIGEVILVRANVSTYSKKGEYRLNVWQVVAQGEGVQALLYQQLREKLASEGLFSTARKRPLPIHPQTIAVITSPQAAAWGDIQTTLQKRYPALHILFCGATVQGAQAPASIVRALAKVQQDNRAEVIILARGGGASEDLSCFNDESVVRAIASSSIPVVTGVGHQRDQSLADLAADVSVHTPTAAAELVVPHISGLIFDNQRRKLALTQSAQKFFAREVQGIEHLKQLLRQLPNTSRILQKADNRREILQQKLSALDPHQVLQRGYTVVTKDNNTPVKSTADVTLGEELTIRLHQGFLKVRITEII